MILSTIMGLYRAGDFAWVSQHIEREGVRLLRRVGFRAFGFGLYYHRFYNSDPDPDPHDHPWDFWTLPFVSYYERVYERPRHRGRDHELNYVPAWRIHHRPAEYLHQVLVPNEFQVFEFDAEPTVIHTVVFHARKRRSWGFHEHDGTFVYWRDYLGVGNEEPER